MSRLARKDEARQVVNEMDASSKSLRGPLILAKMVIDALEKQKQGDGNDYSAIIGHLTAVQMKPVVMQRWLQALRLCVSQLTKEYDLLVGATLRMTWYNKDQEIVHLYIEYLTNLISAQTCYLRSTLLGLVKLLWLPAKEGESVYLNVHLAIGAILKLVPSSPTVLMPLLRKNYPFKGKSVDTQELAIRNVFHITSYCPTLRDDILELVIHQMLTIDVEVPQLTGDEEELCTQDETQFHVELETSGACIRGEKDKDKGSESEPDDRDVLTAVHCQKQMMSNESAEKLDIMMTISFQYLEAQCFHNGTLIVDEALHLLRSLFKIFERVVLPTHACSHVQFLLFRLTSLHESFPGIFLDFLWEKFQDLNTAAVLRQTAAAYIASYVARAKFVPLPIVKLCLTITTQWIHKYMDHCAVGTMKPDVKQHGPFFSLCQAVLYIFVFRHKALIDMEGGGSFIRRLNFERIIISPFNPLKVCLPSVVEVFASLTSRYEIVFCYSIIEQNKRLILSSGILPPTSQDSEALKASQKNILDCFFPFDPYYLKRSTKYVNSLYQVWDDGDDDMVDKEDDDDDDDDQISVASSSVQSESCYGSHSFTMSSPTNSHTMPSFSMSPH